MIMKKREMHSSQHLFKKHFKMRIFHQFLNKKMSGNVASIRRPIRMALLGSRFAMSKTSLPPHHSIVVATFGVIRRTKILGDWKSLKLAHSFWGKIRIGVFQLMKRPGSRMRLTKLRNYLRQ